MDIHTYTSTSCTASQLQTLISPIPPFDHTHMWVQMPTRPYLHAYCIPPSISTSGYTCQHTYIPVELHACTDPCLDASMLTLYARIHTYMPTSLHSFTSRCIHLGVHTCMATSFHTSTLSCGVTTLVLASAAENLRVLVIPPLSLRAQTASFCQTRQKPHLNRVCRSPESSFYSFEFNLPSYR
jgi:hypothetical protein